MTPSGFACRPQALLFDCDGVLVDSDASVVSAWTRWSELYGLDPLAVFPTVHGRRAAETVAALIAEPHRPAALAAINRFELEDAETVTSIPGAGRLLNQLADRRWAVVTSATRSLAEARLAASSLPRPTVLITADDVEAGKPNPSGYLLAAQRLGEASSSCVVLEDALAGVAAARAAGARWVIGIGPRVREADVDAYVPDLRPLTWHDAAGTLTTASA
jgi:mannitol-1-/sugar-/sorbitol-6-phosphatase